ncbi:major facilitator superfamily domain-containing protein [Dichotomocladium elegans]|nr:major facilitator superfamily domain-containing protein [Dichotomocladium elegans]
MTLYTVFTVVCGIANSFVLFFVFRVLQAVVASAGMSVGGGSVADLFHPHERGRAMSIFMLSTMFGPAFSPIVGGYLAQYLGWRWIFYVSAIVGGAILVPSILFLQETLYRPDQEEPKSGITTTLCGRLAALKFNPFVSFRLLLRPDVVLICIPTACVFGWFFYLVTILPNVYLTVYGFSTGSTGLLYLTGGIGNLSGSLAAGVASDWVYRYNLQRHGKVTPEHRLAPIYIGVPFCLVGFVLYGWCVERRFHWFAPLVGYLLYTFGNMFTITTAMSFLIECYLPLSASVVSVGNFARNLAAMILSLLSVQVRTGLGDGWS